jgi:hypothetical protein
MYVNGKMRPVETVSGMGGQGVKESDGGCEFNYDILDIWVRAFVKQCIPSTTIKNLKKKQYPKNYHIAS